LSHIARIEIEIRDLEALKQACNRLGFHFMENQKHYLWYGKIVGNDPLPEGFTEEDFGKCTHAIHVPTAAFEIGVVRRGNAYHLMWDSWIGGGLQKAIGKDAGLLKQAYALESVKREARRKGYRYIEKKMKNGIRLCLSV
jgi:hypothetical protein